MSTRAALFVPVDPGFMSLGERFAIVYCHYDGMPERMIPALAKWTGKQILDARELRSVTETEIEAFPDAREPETVETELSASFLRVPAWASYGYMWFPDAQEWRVM